MSCKRRGRGAVERRPHRKSRAPRLSKMIKGIYARSADKPEVTSEPLRAAALLNEREQPCVRVHAKSRRKQAPSRGCCGSPSVLISASMWPGLQTMTPTSAWPAMRSWPGLWDVPIFRLLWRRRLSLPAAGEPGLTVYWTTEMLRDLERLSNRRIAAKYRIGWNTVALKRRERNIAPATRWNTVRWTSAMIRELGVRPDKAIAQTYDCSHRPSRPSARPSAFRSSSGSRSTGRAPLSFANWEKTRIM